MLRPLRLSGVVAVTTLWTTLLAATAVSGFDLLGDDPLSYLGSDARVAGLFTVGLVVSALLLASFHQFVLDRYPVAPGFSAAMLTGLVGQLVAAVVPIGGGPVVHRVHTVSALVLGISLPVLMGRFAAGQPPGRWRRISYALFWAEATAGVVGVYLSARMIAPAAEILPAAVFHVWIIAVTVKGRCSTEPDSAAYPVTSSRPVATVPT